MFSLYSKFAANNGAKLNSSTILGEVVAPHYQGQVVASMKPVISNYIFVRNTYSLFDMFRHFQLFGDLFLFFR